MADQRIRQIKIKTGVCKRIGKEFVMYKKEVNVEEDRLKRKEESGEDEYVLKKQREVIEESKKMIPDAKSRLRKANEDLKTMLENEKDLAECDEYKDALKALEQAEEAEKEAE